MLRNEFDKRDRLSRRNGELEAEIKKLKAENNEILSSNSWKITKPLRNLRNK